MEPEELLQTLDLYIRQKPGRNRNDLLKSIPNCWRGRRKIYWLKWKLKQKEQEIKVHSISSYYTGYCGHSPGILRLRLLLKRSWNRAE